MGGECGRVEAWSQRAALVGRDERVGIEGEENPSAAGACEDAGVSAATRKTLVGVVGVCLLLLLLTQLDLRELASRLVGADGRWIAAAYASVLIATGIRSVRYAVYFPARGRKREVFGAFAFMRALNIAMPLRSGEVAFVGLLKRLSLAPSVAEVAPVWVALRTSDLVAAAAWCGPLILTAPFALPASAPSVEVTLAVAGGVAGVLALAGVLLVPRALRTERVQGYLQGLRLGLGRLRGKRQAGGVMLLSLVLWFFLIVSPVALLKALGAPLTTQEAFVVAGIMAFVSMLPVHGPLGLGTGDGAWASMLTLAGLPFSAAVALALGLRILSLGLVASDGVIGALLIRKAAFDSGKRRVS